MKKLLVLFFAVVNFNVLAYRLAVTKSKQTIVYADVDLAAPIGYIRSGRKLKVGDNALKQGRIIPLVVSGKIAYVKAEDISFSISGSKLEHVPEVTDHDVNTIFKNDAQRLKENSHFSLDYSLVSPGSDWDGLHNQYSAESTPTLSRINLAVEHRDPQGRHGFKIGLGHLFGSSDVSKITSLHAQFEYQYRVINRSSLSLEAYGGLILTGDFNQTNFSQDAQGGAWGYDIGGRLRIAPFSRIGFYAQASLMQLSPFELDTIATQTVSSVGGLSFGAGVSFKF